MTVTVDTVQLDRAARALMAVAREGLAVPIVEALADEWVTTSQAAAPVDTGQLKARIVISEIGGTPARAEATILSDVPYAGFVEFGTKFQAPNPYFRKGRDNAEQITARLGPRIATELSRAIDSGGVWNPRRIL